MPTGDTTIKKNAPDGLYCIFRFAHKKPDMYRHTFASHVCTGQDRKKRFHQNIGTLHPHISHHSEIEIFFVRARIIRETEKRVPSGPDLSYGCRSSLLFIFAHKMNRRESQPRAQVFYLVLHTGHRKNQTHFGPSIGTICLADKTNHPVERLSLNRSQCGSCSTKYDTSAGT